MIYANPDLFHSQKWRDDVYPFVTPFVPAYASNTVKNHFGKIVDFTHEREWRIAWPYTDEISSKNLAKKIAQLI